MDGLLHHRDRQLGSRVAATRFGASTAGGALSVERVLPPNTVALRCAIAAQGLAEHEQSKHDGFI